jgi:hypothetical protein
MLGRLHPFHLRTLAGDPDDSIPTEARVGPENLVGRLARRKKSR